MLGGNLGSLLYGDDSVMDTATQQNFDRCISGLITQRSNLRVRRRTVLAVNIFAFFE